jgi:outer membrane receptor for ferrienterochelin and colicin
MKYYYFLFLFCLTVVFDVKSQDTINVEKIKEVVSLSLEELLNVEVYGVSRTYGQKSSTAPATVKVITQKQIYERGYRSVLDILSDMPDVKIDYGVDPRWMNDISIRGIRYMDKFQILLNGVKISSPTNDMVSVMENYPVNFAKQVEIIYGPASALYGADAFSGIINIITEKEIYEPIARFSLEGGTANLINGNFYLQNEVKNNFSVTLAGQYFYDQQPDLSKYYPDLYEGMNAELQSGVFANTILGDGVVIDPEARVEPKKSHDLMAYGLYAAFQYKEFSFTYFGNYGKNPSTMANSPHNAVYNKDQFFGHYINMLSLKYEKQFDRVKSQTLLTYSHYNLDSRSNFRNIWVNMEPAYLFAYGWMAKAEQIFGYELNERISFTGGGTFEHFESMPRSNDLHFPVFGNNPAGIIVNTIAPNNPDGIPANLIKTRYNNIGGLVQGQFKLDFPLTLTAGARIDNDERYGATFNPRLGLVYEKEKSFAVKALYGSAFLAPSPQYMYDRFGTFQTMDNGTTYSSFFYQLPNENLKPQKTQTFEASFLNYLTENVSVRATGYTSLVTGLISPVSDTLGSSGISVIDELYPNYLYPGTNYPIHEIQVYDNLGTAMIYGGHLSVDYKKKIFNNMVISATLVYSYIEGVTDIDESGPMEERNLPGISNHTLKFRGTVSWRNFSVSAGLISMSKQRVINSGGIVEETNEYKTLQGYTLVNATLNYKLSESFGLFVKGTNLLNQMYYNVNIGAAAPYEGLGSSAAEFMEGAPQNPMRIMGGFRIFI